MAENKANATAAEVEAETQDEIEQIMSEIEELQQEMSAATAVATDASPKAPQAAVAPPPAPPAQSSLTPPAPKAPPPKPKLVPSPEPVAQEVEAVAAQEIPAHEVSEVEEAESILKEFSGEGEEPWLEETMANLPDNSNESSLLEDRVEPAMEAQELKEEASTQASSHEGGSLTMSVRGNIAIQLKHETSGQFISVGFNQHSIRISVSDGTEFKVPIRPIKNIKKAA
jgi:hypothetical protein